MQNRNLSWTGNERELYCVLSQTLIFVVLDHVLRKVTHGRAKVMCWRRQRSLEEQFFAYFVCLFFKGLKIKNMLLSLANTVI